MASWFGIEKRQNRNEILSCSVKESSKDAENPLYAIVEQIKIGDKEDEIIEAIERLRVIHIGFGDNKEHMEKHPYKGILSMAIVYNLGEPTIECITDLYERCYKAFKNTEHQRTIELLMHEAYSAATETYASKSTYNTLIFQTRKWFQPSEDWMVNAVSVEKRQWFWASMKTLVRDNYDLDTLESIRKRFRTLQGDFPGYVLYWTKPHYDF